MGYYVCQCPACGYRKVVDVQSILNYSFGCFQCGRKSKLKRKRDYGFSIKSWGPYNTPAEAREVLVQIAKADNTGLRINGRIKAKCNMCGYTMNCNCVSHKDKNLSLCYQCFAKYRIQIEGDFESVNTMERFEWQKK